jgi:hypothetical protein
MQKLQGKESIRELIISIQTQTRRNKYKTNVNSGVNIMKSISGKLSKDKSTYTDRLDTIFNISSNFYISFMYFIFLFCHVYIITDSAIDIEIN